MKKEKRFSIDLPVFKGGISFYITDNEQHIENYIRNAYGDAFWEANSPSKTDYYGRMFWKRGYYPIIILTRYPRTPETIGALVHEVLHAVITLLGVKGVELCDNSEEVYTYLTEYLVSEALKKVK